MDTLIEDVKRMIIETLQLSDVKPEDIDPDAPLFGEGLGLDSIDALELGLVMQKRYGISLSSNSQETREHFASVRALTKLIASKQGSQSGDKPQSAA